MSCLSHFWISLTRGRAYIRAVCRRPRREGREKRQEAGSGLGEATPHTLVFHLRPELGLLAPGPMTSGFVPVTLVTHLPSTRVVIKTSSQFLSKVFQHKLKTKALFALVCPLSPENRGQPLKHAQMCPFRVQS